MSIGKNIAKFRKQLNLTQEELGEKLGVTNQAVSKWESAVSMPDVMLLPKIAEALNITLEELYGIAKEGKKALVGADGFPTYCHEKLHELFFVNARMKFGGVDNSDEAQLEFQKQKLKSGCSDERFARMSIKYEEEQKELTERLKELKAKLEKFASQSVTADMFISTVRKYTRAKKLTQQMLNELIQKIEVFNAEKVRVYGSRG